MKTVAAATLGCKVNRFETERMLDLFEASGFSITSYDSSPDILILNTCAVTVQAERQSRQMIYRAIRSDPSGVLIVTGCLADRDTDKLSRLKGVDYLIGNAAKEELGALIAEGIEKQKQARVLVPDVQRAPSLTLPRKRGREGVGVSIARFRDRARAILKIQDGCDAGCAFCIVPTVRGPGRSVPADAVIAQAARFAAAGHAEIVLSGIHLGAYGRDLYDGLSFSRLIERIAAEVAIPRLRISSIEPMEIDQELIGLLEAGGPLCPHLHIPLQSGDAEILGLMNRHYAPDQYAALIEELVRRIPDLCIGADVMAGFPGETPERFVNTLRFVRELPLAYLHVFPYSPRPGTRAEAMRERIPIEVIRRRTEELRLVGLEKRRAFNARFLGRLMDVILEEPVLGRPGWARGLTRNNIVVTVPASPPFPAGPVPVVIETIVGDLVEGTLS